MADDDVFGMVIKLPIMHRHAVGRPDVVDEIEGAYVIDHGTPCAHHQQDVCAAQRTVKCRICGAALDPFDAFYALVKDWHKVRYTRALLKQANEELEALKDEQRRVRASIRGYKRSQQ